MDGQKHLLMLNRFFQKPLVSIRAGPESAEFHVHAGALEASGSAFLKASVSDRWHADSSRPLDWTNWDADTVQRVIQWLYTKDYEVPTPTPRQESSKMGLHETDSKTANSPSEERVAIAIGAGPATIQQSNRITTGGLRSTPKKVLSGTAGTFDNRAEASDGAALMSTFDTKPLKPLSDFITGELEDSSQGKNGHVFVCKDFPHKDYSYDEILMSLANLNAFADLHLCKELQNSTINRIIEVLLGMDCSLPDAVFELTNLIEYTYSTVAAAPHVEHSLRNVVSHFVAINITNLMHDGFDSFVFRGDEFTADVSRKICQRLFVADALNVHLEFRAVESDALNARLESKVEETSAANDRLKSRVKALKNSLKDQFAEVAELKENVEALEKELDDSIGDTISSWDQSSKSRTKKGRR